MTHHEKARLMQQIQDLKNKLTIRHEHSQTELSSIKTAVNNINPVTPRTEPRETHDIRVYSPQTDEEFERMERNARR